MIIPPRIRIGETIGICAPAGPCPPERLAAGIARLGGRFRTKVSPSLSRAPDPLIPKYLAASDDERVDELHAMLADPDVRAIVLARGGYGLQRILPKLDPDLLRRDPKPIVGFSDGTALLAWAYAAGVHSIHGPMIGQLGEVPDEDVERLVSALTDPTPRSLSGLVLAEDRGPRTEDPISGRVVAGNLTLIAMLAGTKWPVPLAGSIAVIEEVGERPYRLDRYIATLRLHGALDDLSAIVLGDLVRCDEPNDTGSGLRTFLACTSPTPVATSAMIGHGTRNQCIAFGARATLDLVAGVLELHEPCVS